MGLVLVCVLFPVLTGFTHALEMIQDGPMPFPARAHCRVFVVAARTHTRVLALQNEYEQDGIPVYDHSPALSSILEAIDDPDSMNQQQEQQHSDRAYQILRPAITQAAEWLKPKVEPGRCFAHFVVTESETIFGYRTQDEATMATARVTKRLNQLREQARSDVHFPFALNTLHHEDGSSVMSSGDLQVVTSTWRRFFHVLGMNYFSGRVAPSLSPGQVEVFGVMHVDAGGHTGRNTSVSDTNAAEMVFDVRERWRRNKRQRQVNVALNSSDFYGREYGGFGRLQVQQEVIKLKQDEQKNADTDALQHPCFSKGHVSVVDGMNVTLEGSGDADKCMTLLRSHVAVCNANCPQGSFCFLGSAPQPQGFGSFYASGVLRLAVLSASRVLKHLSTNWDRTALDELQLPAPTLLTLRNAAKNLCALPYEDVVAAAAPSHFSASKTTTIASAMEKETEPPSALCFDLCYTVVLLEQIGVQDDDERVHFVDRFDKEPLVSERGPTGTRQHELVAWLTGAFLYLEALQRKVTFFVESELLAEQLSAGLPLGWNMTLMVFIAACVFLYLTTGPIAVSGQGGRGSGGYNRVVNGGAKTKYKDTTQSIIFVDDARD